MTDCTHYWTVTSECPKCLRVLLDAEREAHAHTTAERDSHRACVTSPILAMLTAEQRERYGVEPVVPGSHERDPAQLVTRLCDALANVEAERDFGRQAQDAAIVRAESAERRADMAERGLAAGWQTLTTERDALRRLCAKAREALKRSLGGYSDEELSRWRAQYIAEGDNGSKMAGWLLAIEALDEAEKR